MLCLPHPTMADFIELWAPLTPPNGHPLHSYYVQALFLEFTHRKHYEVGTTIILHFIDGETEAQRS